MSGDGAAWVLIAGVTGRCGFPVARRLRAAGLRVRGLTRDPSGHRAQTLRELGVELIRGDLLQPETLPAAFEDVSRALLITTPAHGFHREVTAGASFARAAREARVTQVVFQSVLYADTAMPHCASKGLVERELERLGLSWTALRAGYFLDTLPAYLAPEARRARTVTTVIEPRSRVWWIAVDDLAALSAHLLSCAGPPAGCLDAVAPQPLSFAELTELLSRHTGDAWRCSYESMSYERLFGELVTLGRLDPDDAKSYLARADVDPAADYYRPVSREEVEPDLSWLSAMPVTLRSPRDAVADLVSGSGAGAS